MSVVIVDSSTIISCAMNCLLWVFKEMSNKGIKFMVPQSVKKEVIDSGINSKKFKYEAIRVLEHFSNGTFNVYEGNLKKETSELLGYANSSFYIKNNPMKILQEADAEVAALGKRLNADLVLTDEKTLRLLIENPKSVKEMLEAKFGTNVRVDEKALYNFNQKAGGIDVARSTELISLAYTVGVFDEILKKCYISGEFDCKKELIEGLLLSLKFSGCAVSFEEINDYVNLLLRSK